MTYVIDQAIELAKIIALFGWFHAGGGAYFLLCWAAGDYDHSEEGARSLLGASLLGWISVAAVLPLVLWHVVRGTRHKERE